MSGKLSTRLGAALAALTALVFAPGLRARFLWDDHPLIQHNPALRSLGALGRALTRHFWDGVVTAGMPARPNQYYRPVVTLAYYIQWQLFGDHPAGYHVVSLSLHIGCVLLVYGWLLRRLGGDDAVAAAVGAALFALHPTRPESVTWIAGSTDLWMTLGVFSALTAWDRRRDGLAAVALVLAMLAKESAVLVPAVLAIDAVMLSPTPNARRGELGRVGALALVVGVATALRLALIRGRAVAVAQDGPVEVLRRVLATIGCYVRAALWHWPPTVHLGIKLLDAQHRAVYPQWTIPLGVVAVLGIVVLCLAAARRQDLRPWLTDVAWFVFPLAPALNLVDLRLAVLAEPHNLYLPLAGLAALAARTVHGWVNFGRRVALVIAASTLAACAAVTVFHETRLQNDLSLWTWEHRIAPDNLLAVQALSAAAREGARPLDALRLDAEGCARAQRLGLRSTTAGFARAATEDGLIATAPADRASAQRVMAFCTAIATGNVAVMAVAGSTLTVPAGVSWRATLARDPAFVAACREAARRLQ